MNQLHHRLLLPSDPPCVNGPKSGFPKRVGIASSRNKKRCARTPTVRPPRTRWPRFARTSRPQTVLKTPMFGAMAAHRAATTLSSSLGSINVVPAVMPHRSRCAVDRLSAAIQWAWVRSPPWLTTPTEAGVTYSPATLPAISSPFRSTVIAIGRPMPWGPSIGDAFTCMT